MEDKTENNINIKEETEIDVQIIGTIFSGVGNYGDFDKMIKSGRHNDTIFIYNDNEEEYYDKSSCKGAGNAIIRKYNQFSKYSKNPMSIGIPTGTLEFGGYTDLNDENKIIIDDCISNLIKIIKTHTKTKIFYSAKNHTGILGTGIFKVSEDVLKYITNQIFNLTSKEILIIKSIKNENNKEQEQEQEQEQK